MSSISIIVTVVLGINIAAVVHSRTYRVRSVQSLNACYQSCGSTRSRTRKCSVPGGCKGSSVESKPCSSRPCCAQWSQWSQCPVTCVTPGYNVKSMTQLRRRRCMAQEGVKAYGSSSGVKQYATREEKQNRPCRDLPQCSQWSTWSSWGRCSATCGSGIQDRTRACTPSGQCNGKTYERQPCNYLPPCAQWSSWSSWGRCSATCGSGTQDRTRSCTPSGQCNGKTYERRPCSYLPRCAQWLPWSSWGQCSVTCGSGTQDRTRICTPSVGLCSGKHFGRQPCKNLPPCAQWSSWSPWGQCSVTCGHGEKQRKQTCVPAGSQCNGRNHKYEKEPCFIIQCAEWSPWSQWGRCSVTCGSGIQDRTRICTPFGQCTGERFERKKCDKEQCAEWLPWSPWGECSVTCGTGETQRTRTCTPPNAYCDGRNNEKQQCYKGRCPAWNQWSRWSDCTVTCNGGTTQRSRTCSMQDRCIGERVEQKSCNEQHCPDWLPWNTWSSCTATCNGGNTQRSRTCSIQDRCIGERVEQKSCNEQHCPDWLPWNTWSSCTATCNGGNTQRNRTCSIQGRCIGNRDEQKSCNEQPCPEWLPWNAWNSCTATCGGGQHTRDRDCTIPGKCDKGEPSETKSCNNDQCPGWDDWTPWTPCDVTCGRGQRSRTRSCSLEGQCDGSPREVDRNCNSHSCPDWSPWTSWSMCSKSCEGGTTSHDRTCLFDLNYCSDSKNKFTRSCNCVGDDEEEKLCNDQVCPQIGEWGPWSPCDSVCGEGGGQQTRTRNCQIDPGFCSSRPDHETCICLQDSEEIRMCNSHQCAEWTQWQPWTECSKPCDRGSRSRDRTCRKDEFFCSDNRDHESCLCPGNPSETGPCNEHECAQWENWGPWGDCDKSCESGIRKRDRKCKIDQTFCSTVDQNRQSCECSGVDGETEPCNTHDCPKWGQWEGWTDCSKLCRKEGEIDGGTQTRQRKCQTDPGFCVSNPTHEACTCLRDPSETRSCNRHRCAIWSPWRQWSRCDKPCGTGSQKRQRTCLNDVNFCSQNPGHQSCLCVGEPDEIQPCNEHDCAEWLPWELWSECDKPCNRGTRNRIRECKTAELFCSTSYNRESCQCVGEDDETESCNTHACPQWENWGLWSNCDKLCRRRDESEGGKQSRTRVCRTDPRFCTADKLTHTTCQCLGDSSEEKECNRHVCAYWGEWPIWDECSKTCGSGTHTRTRLCIADTSYCFDSKTLEQSCRCDGKDKESDMEPCNEHDCPNWGSWVEWSDCSVTCNRGTKKRTRQCVLDSAYCSGKPSDTSCICLGTDNDETNCNLGPCPTYNEWTPWGVCNTLCGVGRRNRTRQCSVPGECTNLGRSYNEQVCFEDCQEWGGWGEWTSCSKSCDDGTKTRTRVCPIADACGTGSNRTQEDCNLGKCPLWDEWGQWGSCSHTCGNEGFVKRTRTCLTTDVVCEGNDDDYKRCDPQAECPRYTHWSEWTHCTKTCGKGVERRSRAVCPEPDCAVEPDERICNTFECPSWGVWQEAPCTTTCGFGLIRKTRSCLFQNGTKIDNGCAGAPRLEDECPNLPACALFWFFF